MIDPGKSKELQLDPFQTSGRGTQKVLGQFCLSILTKIGKLITYNVTTKVTVQLVFGDDQTTYKVTIYFFTLANKYDFKQGPHGS